jgi:malate synthase
MNTTMLNLAYGMKIAGEWQPEYEQVMSLEALKFVKKLHQRFDDRRKDLLENRILLQANLNNNWKPGFPEETSEIRNSDWTVAPIPQDLLDRRVEITGPVDRKMIINALNSGAKVFMADFEDSNSPTWTNIVEGQINLHDAIRKTIDFENPETGKQYQLNDDVATLMVRPRGLHLHDKHVLIGDEPISGSLLDFGLYLFNNAKELMARGSGPYFYLPKLEHYEEARWWNDVFVFAQEQLGIPQGTIKATVLIETILASYQLDEILFELKDHSAGLNCGRWDYIFSFIKRFQNQDGFVFPDRDQVTMAVPFMRAYSQLVIKTCHKRGVHAMGGMAAQIPIKGDDEANRIAFEKVKADKVREAGDGHDGTWVAHPGLVHVAMDVFNEYMPQANQIAVKREDVEVTEEDLIAVPEGTITEQGVRKNINVGIQYIAAWLSGNGAAAIYNLMEDAATAEISRTQVWQWLHNGVALADGRTFNTDLYTSIFEAEMDLLRHADILNPAWKDRLEDAAEVFDQLIRSEELKEFLTLEAYPLLD